MGKAQSDNKPGGRELGMGNQSFEIRLRNAAGIPVLQVCGTVTKTALKAVRFTLDRLASAGHYHVVLNIENAHAPKWDMLAGLSGAVSNILKHYGAVDLVATQERMQQLLGIDRIAKLFRLSGSEGQAISRIKRLNRPPDDAAGTDARLLEKQ